MLFKTPWPVLVTILAQTAAVGPGGTLFDKLFQYGILPAILGFLLYYQDKNHKAEKAEWKKDMDAKELENKGLYELQSKEYKASLTIMAASTDVNNKLIQMLHERNDNRNHN